MEIQQTAPLLANCGPKPLEQKDLAVLGLDVVGINVGLKAGSLPASTELHNPGLYSLVELEHPAANHSLLLSPPHS